MDIDTTPPTAHHDNRPAMQLDIPPPDEIMMEVDADISFAPAPVVAAQEAPNTLLPAAVSVPHQNHTAPWLHPSSPSRPLDVAPSSLRVLPNPPAAIVTSSDVSSWPKLKLDQLFIEWFARPDSKTWLTSLLQDAHVGKTPDVPNAEHPARSSRLERSVSPGRSKSPNPSHSNPSASAQQAPGSPVSRLFRTHVPLGDSDSSPRSPPMASIATSPLLKAGSAGAHVASSMDLGRSGTLSPLKTDLQNSSPALIPLQNARLDSAGFLSTELTPTRLLADGDDSRASGKETASPNTMGNASGRNGGEVVADGIAGIAVVVSSAAHGQDAAGKEKRDSPSGDKSTVDVSVSDSSPNRTDVVFMRQVSSSSDDTVKERDGTAAELANGAPMAKLEPQRFDKSVENSVPIGSVEGGSLSSMMDVTRTDSKEAPSSTEPIRKDGSGGRADSPAGSGRVKMDVSGKVSSEIPPASPRPSLASDASSVKPGPRVKRKSLPRFYYPCGRDAEVREDKEREAMTEFFRSRRAQKKPLGVNRTDIAELVVEVVGLPSYFASIVYNAVVEQFPVKAVGNAASSGDGDAPGSRVLGSGEESMKDVGASDERSSRSSVSGMERSVGREEAWQTNSDTTMGDVQDGSNDMQRANGVAAMDNVVGSSEESRAAEGAGFIDATDGMVVSANDFVTEEQLMSYYKTRCCGHSREARLFQALLGANAGRDYLIPSDFKPLMRALLMCHQGLAFLHATPEFQQRYSETVIERIYFGCTRQHNGRLTLADIKRSKLLDTLMVVDEEEDINRERRFFSYEHFYVLYCRFWELDANHDLQIDKEDLMRYGSHCLTNRIVDRIFSGHARPLDAPENGGYMSYTDFIWFCLSEEDKTSDTAIDYWFRCVDRDGDGLITMYDMEWFYKEQLHRMESFGHEPVHIRDILCQLLDMINPNMRPPVIRRRDLKRCRLAGNFFNVLFNLNKFFAIEARDPLQIRQEHATPQLTDWDRFAALEYLRLSADEEGDEDESWEEVGEAANPLMAGEAPF